MWGVVSELLLITRRIYMEAPLPVRYEYQSFPVRYAVYTQCEILQGWVSVPVKCIGLLCAICVYHSISLNEFLNEFLILRSTRILQQFRE